jgi:hypothetical protein
MKTYIYNETSDADHEKRVHDRANGLLVQGTPEYEYWVSPNDVDISMNSVDFTSATILEYYSAYAGPFRGCLYILHTI